VTITVDFQVYRSVFIRIVIPLGAIDFPVCVKLRSPDPSNSHSSGRFPSLVLHPVEKIYTKEYGLTDELLLALEGTVILGSESQGTHDSVLLMALGVFRTPLSLTPYKRLSLVILPLCVKN
jgi:hypothetical protein